MALTLISSQEICQQLAARCKTLRLSRNIGQQELAAKAGVSFGTIRRFEHGETVSLENFIRILEAFGRADEMLRLLDQEPSLSIAKLEALENAKLRRRATHKKS